MVAKLRFPIDLAPTCSSVDPNFALWRRAAQLLESPESQLCNLPALRWVPLIREERECHG
jgi:hypothetical protein